MDSKVNGDYGRGECDNSLMGRGRSGNCINIILMYELFNSDKNFERIMKAYKAIYIK